MLTVGDILKAWEYIEQHKDDIPVVPMTPQVAKHFNVKESQMFHGGKVAIRRPI